MSVLIEVFNERMRQIEKEGFSKEHDDQHVNQELLIAANLYYQKAIKDEPEGSKIPSEWPWEPEWWKPKDKHHNLIVAGALIIAEGSRRIRNGVKEKPIYDLTLRDIAQEIKTAKKN